MPRVTIDWRDVLKEFIAGAGTMGRKQGEITNRFRNLVRAEQINHELEVLHLEDKVQRFDVSNKTIWRATRKIFDA